jgi:hypothetical protein
MVKAVDPTALMKLLTGLMDGAKKSEAIRPS